MKNKIRVSFALGLGWADSKVFFFLMIEVWRCSLISAMIILQCSKQLVCCYRKPDLPTLCYDGRQRIHCLPPWPL